MPATAHEHKPPQARKIHPGATLNCHTRAIGSPCKCWRCWGCLPETEDTALPAPNPPWPSSDFAIKQPAPGKKITGKKQAQEYLRVWLKNCKARGNPHEFQSFHLRCHSLVSFCFFEPQPSTLRCVSLAYVCRRGPELPPRGLWLKDVLVWAKASRRVATSDLQPWADFNRDLIGTERGKGAGSFGSSPQKGGFSGRKRMAGGLAVRRTGRGFRPPPPPPPPETSRETNTQGCVSGDPFPKWVLSVPFWLPFEKPPKPKDRFQLKKKEGTATLSHPYGLPNSCGPWGLNSKGCDG